MLAEAGVPDLAAAAAIAIATTTTVHGLSFVLSSCLAELIMVTSEYGTGVHCRCCMDALQCGAFSERCVMMM